jgi:hypothetical protein
VFVLDTNTTKTVVYLDSYISFYVANISDSCICTYVAPAKNSSFVLRVTKPDSIARKTTSDNIITATRAEDVLTERQIIIGSDSREMMSNTIIIRATLPINGVENMNTCGSLDILGCEFCYLCINFNRA